MPLSKEQGEAVWLKRWPAWLEKAHAKHDGKYTYPSPTRDESGKVKVVCSEHGEFWQLPAKHVFGQGCGKCSGRGADRKQALERAYPEWDWSGVAIPETTKEMFTFHCTQHGPQESSVNRLLTKPGTSPCPRCSRLAGAYRVSPETWEQRITEQWGDGVTLDLDSVEAGRDKARFTCKAHGLFTSILADVANGHGCPSCGRSQAGEACRTGFDDFRALARLNHGDRYTYHPDTYTVTAEKTKITCKGHGDFWQIARNHTSPILQAGCPKCSMNVSKGEEQVAEYLRSLGLVVQERVRPLKTWELDILLPELNVAVEYCGIYWHGDRFKEAMYHQEKQQKVAATGIRLITVFCDEWRGSRAKVEAQLRSLVGRSHKVGARQCSLVKLPWLQAKAFLDEFHLQNAGRPAAHCYGLVKDGLLLEVATWGTDRFSESGDAELLRLCTRADYTVSGGLSRLISAFKADTGAQKLLTYADLRWGEGAGYGKVGFKRVGTTPPGYFWAKGLNRWSRVRFQKHKLEKLLEVFDPKKSETENCIANGYWKVYDCGHAKWQLDVSGGTINL